MRLDVFPQDAHRLLSYLDRPIFFDQPYFGNIVRAIVVYDESLAADYSTNDTSDDFEDWQTLLESITPAWPDMPRSVEREILEILDMMQGKSYSGIGRFPLINNMIGDISRLLHCYAFGNVHQLWHTIEQAYLHSGIPCGWEGNYPAGKLIIFSK